MHNIKQKYFLFIDGLYNKMDFLQNKQKQKITFGHH